MALLALLNATVCVGFYRLMCIKNGLFHWKSTVYRYLPFFILWFPWKWDVTEKTLILIKKTGKPLCGWLYENDDFAWSTARKSLYKWITNHFISLILICGRMITMICMWREAIWKAGGRKGETGQMTQSSYRIWKNTSNYYRFGVDYQMSDKTTIRFSTDGNLASS